MSITRSSPVQVAAYSTTYSQGPKLLSTSWSKISVGPSHVLAIKSNNTLWSWGVNTFGQLGDGTTTTRSSPVQVGTNPTYDWYDVAAGINYSVALRGDRLLFVWGINTAGQIGDFTTVNKSSPVQVGTSSWTTISAGGTHVAAIRSDKTLWVWGLNTSGQLGTNNYLSFSSPVQVGTSSYISVSAGQTHTTAITSDYKLFTWGDNTTGQLGYTTPSQPNYSWTQIAGNSDYTIAIRQDGILFGWGTNNLGQLGLSDTINRSSPVQIGTNSWSVVTANAPTGGGPTLAIRSDGTLWGWGYNVTGVLGVGDTAYRSSPVQVSGGGSWITVSASKSHTVALKSDYTLYTWGLGTSGQLGDGLISRSSPVKVGTSSWTKVSSGELASYAIRTDGGLFAWGSNTNGQQGDITIATTVLRSSPTQIGSNSWTSVFAFGTSFVHAIDSSSKLFAWGANTGGQLGYGDVVTRSSPVQISNGNWSTLGGYGSITNTLGIQTDGSLWGWGSKSNLLLGEFSNGSFTYSWSQVSAGPSHTAAVRSDGRLYTWGLNSVGQLGNSTTVNTSSPTLIATVLGGPSEYWNRVSVNGLRTVAIRNDGTLWSWGSNAGYLLGDGTSINRSAPIQITSVSASWNNVSAGLSHTLAISSLGRIYSWGDNTYQQLGIGATDSLRSVPVQIGTSSWSQVSSYGTHNLALDVNNKLYSWGDNTLGQIGISSSPLQWNIINTNYLTGFIIRSDGIAYGFGGNNSTGGVGNGTAVAQSSPVLVSSGGSWNQITLGNDNGSVTTKGNAVGIKSDGTLWTWGDNNFGQSGDITLALTVNRSAPVQIGTSTWLTVDTAYNTVLAIKSDYTLWAWGKNTNGQLGDGTTIARSSPIQIGTSSWTQIVSSANYSMAIRLDGSLWVWGYGVQSGFTDGVSRSSPVQIGSGLSFTQVAGKENSRIALNVDGTLLAWGYNGYGELGDGTNLDRSSPVQIGTTTGALYDSISVSTHAIAKRKDGTIWTWGNNTYGQLGLSLGSTSHRSSPVQVGTSSWVNVSAGFWNTLATTTTGPNGLQQVYAWGYNQTGNLGTTDTAHRSSPVQIASGTLIQSISSPTQIGTNSWTNISAGLSNSMAIRSDYKLYTWGDNSQLQSGYITPATALGAVSNNNAQSYIRSTDNALIIWGANDYGQVGDGTTVNRSSPIQLGAGLGNNQFKKIARAKLPSLGYTVGIKTDGTLWGWGYNVWGQLGNSATTGRSSPTQISALTNWSDVAVGQSHTLAIKTDGTLWGWGLNTSGQAGVLSWAKVSSGSSHTLALRSDGSLYGWGSNTVGQVGDISTVNRSSPVQLGAGYSWNTVVAGINISAAIRGDNLLFTWGNNANGTLGLADTANRSSPTQVGASFWSQVSTRDYMAGLTSDNRLFTWGINSGYQLGDGTTNSRSSPVQVGTANPTSTLANTNAYSSFFNNSGYLTVPDNASLELAANNFTIECWIYPTSTAAQQIIVGKVATGSVVGSYDLRLNTNGTLQYNVASASGVTWATTANTSGTVSFNVWNHIAFVRNTGGVFTVYINGTSAGTSTNNITLVNETTTTNIGANGNGSSPFSGYITNVRITNGQALYTANFTPSTSPLTTTSQGAIASNVVLLTCQNTTFIDNSSTGSTITNNSSVTSSIRSPFATLFSQVSTGSSYMAAIRTDSGLFIWGTNTNGQLGLNDVALRSQPTQIGSSSWSAVSTSNNAHTLAVTTAGNLYAWGNNTFSQLGLGDAINRSSPVQIGTSSWTNIYAGTNYSLALRTDNTVFAWGSGPSGQLGIITPLSWTGISAGIGIHNDYTLWSWGDNTSGQLGISSTQYRSSPVQLGTVSWTNVYSTTSNSYAIKSDGTLWSWGTNTNGQLGLSDTLNRSSPVQIGTDTNWSTVVASATGHALALKTTGALYAWGFNQYNELGQNQIVASTNTSSPVQVGSSSWTKISAGNNYSLAIRTDGALFAWGRNDWGQSGLNNNTPLSWTTVAGGDNYSVAIRSDGKLFSWGRNDKGQLGLGHTVSKSAPTQIAVSTNYNLYSTFFNGTTDYLTVTNNAAFALGSGDFTVECWFYTNTITAAQNHIFDTRTTATGSTNPNLYMVNATMQWLINGTSILTGTIALTTWTHIAVVKRSGIITMYINGVSTSSVADSVTYTSAQFLLGKAWDANYCNGYISNFRMVKGTAVYTGNFAVPTTPLTNITNTSLLTCQNDRFIDNGTANTGGTPFTLTPSGTGITTSTLTPFQTTTYNYSWTQVSATLSHTVAIRNDGTLWAWGDNSAGQLGQGDIVPRSAPLQVGSSSWTNVFAGLNSTYAIRTDGALFTAGDNTYGQLAQSDITNRSSLTQIPGTTSWTSVSASLTGHVLSIASTGALYAWGYNQYNELGLNDRNPIMRSAPVQVGSATTWTKVSAGNNFSLGVSAFGLWAWGKNDYGQAPPATGTVLTALSWTQVAGGDSYSVAIRSDGKLFSWGLNSKGQLGLGHTVNRSAPTQIALSTNANYLSTAFNGTNDGLTIPSGVLPTSAGTAFTFEGWFYLTRATSAVSKILSGGNTELNIDNTTPGQIRFDLPTGVTNVMNSGTTVMQPNLWYHIAITRTTGNLYTMYLNGIAVGSGTQATASTAITNLGAQGQTNPYQGYMYGVRTVTSLLYTGNFTPSISPPTAISGTTLLTCMNYNFADISGTQNITVGAGSVGISPSTIIPPMQTTAYNYSFTQVSATLSHVLAIRADGALFAWGANNGGQLGQGDTANRSSPIQIGTSSWTKVAAGSDASFATRTDGALFGWGDNTNGILGQGNTTAVSSPVVINSGTSWTNISARQHILATTSLGAMYAWGLNNAGQLGTTNINAAGDTVNRSTPVQLGVLSWALVSAGNSFSMATNSSGLLFSWGFNTQGQLGSGLTTARSSPVQVGTSSWSVIASGTSWAAGISAVRLFIWGGSSNYELGVGTTALRSAPVQLGLLSWTAIGGTTNPIGIQAVTGSLFGWGVQAAGQLGQNDVALRSSPVQIASLTGLVFDNQSSPTQIGTSSWSQVQAGTGWGAGVTTAGTLFTWGFGINGELASGATTARSSPVQVGALTTWSKISGTTHALATLTTGTSTLVAWGNNALGQLGDITAATKSSPVAVGLLTNLTLDTTKSPTQIGTSSWTQISAGDFHVLALRYLDGGLFTWGKGDQGQLGSGLTTARSSPVQVGTTSWSQIATGVSTGAAITTLGGLFTWGLGINGQQGSAATTSRSAPTQLGTSSWSLVSSVKDAMFGVTIANQLYAWGNNNLGQLGLSDTVLRSSPVQVGTNIQTLYSNPTQINSSILPNSYSTYFNGTNDYLMLASNAAFAFGAGNFTVECWIYANSASTVQVIFDLRTPDTANIGFDLFLTSSTIRFGTNGTLYITGTTTLLSNTWYHVALSRSGTTTYQLFLNGVQEGSTYTTSQTFTNNTPRIGNGVNGFFNGYISNLRVISGQGLYTGTFIPSKTLLTNNTVGSTGSGAAASITGTVVLLTCQSSTIIDNSGNSYPIQIAGMPVILGTSYTQISAGESDTTFIATNGVLFNVGDNTTGQIGDSTTVTKSFLQVVANPTLYDNRSSPAQIGTGSWSQIAAGADYSIAIKSDGTLYAWGINTNGYLGDGTTLTRRSMTQIGTSSYTSISSGGSHTMALKNDLTLYAWGLNNAGQLGDNSVVNRSSPVQVNTVLVTSWNSVSAGASHTSAIDATNNLPYGWGLNNAGQVGDNTLVNKSAPVQVSVGTTSNYSYQFNGSTNYLTSAASASYQLTSNFTIEFWFYAIALNVGSGSGLVAINDAIGPNSFLGLSIFLDTGGILSYFVNGNTNSVAGPTIVIGTWYHVALVRSGSTNTLYLNGVSRVTSSTTPNWSSTPSIGIGRVYNDNTSFVLNGYISNVRIVKGTALYTSGFYPSTGALTTSSQGATPSQVLLLTAQSATIVDNSVTPLTFTNTGTVTASTTNPFGPYYSASFNGNNQSLTILDNTALQLSTVDFTVECWVYSTASQVANSGILSKGDSVSNTGFTLNVSGTTLSENRSNITTSSGAIPVGNWTHIAWVRASGVAYLYVNGIAQASKADTYNYNQTSSLRIGINRSTANFAGYISNLRIVKGTAVYTGNFATPANILRTIQTASTNIVGLTGTETSLLTLQSATIVDNSTNAFAITNTNAVTITTAYTPFSASTAGVVITWDSIQAGVNHTTGTSNNTLFTWGNASGGALADNTITSKSAPTATGVGSIWSVAEKLFSSPVQVGTAKSWSLIAAGPGHTVAMATDYTLWAWGQNTTGQLGDTTTIGKSSPTQIAGNTSSYTFITAGVSDTFAIRTTTALLYAWGLNTAGQLGLNDTANRSSPVQVFAGTMTSPLIPIKLVTVSGSSYTQVQVGSAATVIGSNGLLYTWGTNTSGQIGDFTTVNRSSPVQIGSQTFTYFNSPIQVGTSSYSQVSAGYSHTLAIDTNSLLYAWGKTPANGNTVTRSSPVQIGNNSWLFVSAGNDVSQAIDNTRTLYTWGLNTNYQLGSASFALNQSVTSPVAIGTLAITNYDNTIGTGAGNGSFIKNI